MKHTSYYGFKKVSYGEFKPEPQTNKQPVIGEFIVASLIFGALFYVPWIVYIVTGEYMEF